VLSTTCQVSYLFNATATTTTVMNCCTHNDTDQYVLDRRSILGSVFCFFVNEAPNTRPNAQSIASNPNITAQLRVERIESMVMGGVWQGGTTMVTTRAKHNSQYTVAAHHYLVTTRRRSTLLACARARSQPLAYLTAWRWLPVSSLQCLMWWGGCGWIVF
jgi:hypothetical protein